MPTPQKNQPDPFDVAQIALELARTIQEEEYRKLTLVAQPAIKVYEWFYTN